MSRSLLRSGVALSSLFLLCGLACSSENASEPVATAGSGSGGAAGAAGHGSTPSTCVPGRKEACACLSGVGTQECLADGSALDVCICPKESQGGAAGSAAGAGGSPSVVQQCVPGIQEACACANGTGVQRCSGDGSGFGPCLCADTGAGGGAGADGGGGIAGGAPTAGSGGSNIAGAGGSNLAGAGGSNLAGAGGSNLAGAGGAGGSNLAGAGGSNLAGAGGLTTLPPLPGDPDGDHWTVAQGDCDEANSDVNPGAFEVPGNGRDDDCDGQIDPASTSCDQGLGPVITDAVDGARALGLCGPLAPESPATKGAGTRSGLITATFANISGAFLSTPPKTGASTKLQLGVLPNFGSGTPTQEGERLLALSSGVARATGQADAVANLCQNSRAFSGNSGYPPGFPKTEACGKKGNPKDGIALDVRLRVPSNARSFRIRYKFFSCDFPQYLCTTFNDVFAILMAPSPPGTPAFLTSLNEASADIAFFTTPSGGTDLVTINSQSLITACTPAPGYTSCQGEAGLSGSGFEGHGASSWVVSHVPVPTFAAGEDHILALRLAIWDSADDILDSTATVDGFEWSTEPLSAPTSAALP
jgi:hypothetical protein